MWHIMSSKDGCHSISHISGSSDTLEFYPIKRWCLCRILLSLPGSQWLLQYMAYSRSDAMWLLRLDYKNAMPFTLLSEGFSLLELSHHVGRKLKHLWRGSHREEPKAADPQAGLSFWANNLPVMRVRHLESSSISTKSIAREPHFPSIFLLRLL